MTKRKKNLKSTIWGGRFEGVSSDNLIKFNSSISFDKSLYAQDIEGSIAHAEMLSKQKIILKKDFLEIKRYTYNSFNKRPKNNSKKRGYF